MRLLIIFLFLSLSKSSEISNEAENREKKLFSLFTIVNFPNDQCTSKSDNTMFGTCYSSSECIDKSGTADGNCAAGFGVCCTFTSSTCGGSVTQNCSYITNPSYPTTYSTAGSCAWSVTPVSSEICQLRLDFDNFDITDAATGDCTDSLTVAGPTGRNPMDLCGTNTDLHLYVEQGRSTTATTLTFTIATGGTWKIKVTQIECWSLARANPGCEQWFTGVSGTFQSYNWPTVALRAKTFVTCFRQELGYCAMDFNEYDVATPDPFAIDDAGANSLNSGTAFGEGFLDITGSSSDSSHISGAVFSDALANGAATPSTVRSTGGNYIIAYNTLDADQTGELGYKLTYSQVPCGQ